MADETQYHLARLEPRTRQAAFVLVDAARRAGIPLVISSSRRSLSEQKALLLQGRTRTLQSKHLAGKAFDVDWFGVNRDQVPPWLWSALGPFAEKNLGLIWGGRFKTIRDPGHFEF